MNARQPTRGHGAAALFFGVVGCIIGGALALNGSPWVGTPILILCAAGIVAGLAELDRSL